MIYNPGVSIVIVNYNGISDTAECLHSLKETTYSDYEIIVVDNGSTDNSLEVLEKRNDIRLIKLDRNYGPYEAWNIGVKHAKYEYVCIMNNDIVADKNWLAELMRTMQEPQVAESYASFFPYHERFDTIGNIEKVKHLRSGTLTLLGYLIAFNFFNDYETTSLDADPGCCIIRKSLIDEPFDKDYFIYYGGPYLAWKVRLMGYNIKRSPLCLVYHKLATSKGKHLGNTYRYFLHERNRLMNILLFYSRSTLIKMTPLILFDVAKKVLVIVFNIFIRPGYAIDILKAYAWILLNFGRVLGKRARIQALRKVDDSKIISLLSYKWTDRKSLFANVANVIFYKYCKAAGLKTYDIINK